MDVNANANANANVKKGPTGKHHYLCEYGTCDSLATAEFGVGQGAFVPTRGRLKLCWRHVHVLRGLAEQPDQDEAEMAFFKACGLVPLLLEAEGMCGTCGHTWHGRAHEQGPLTFTVPCVCGRELVASAARPSVSSVSCFGGDRGRGTGDRSKPC